MEEEEKVTSAASIARAAQRIARLGDEAEAAGVAFPQTTLLDLERVADGLRRQLDLARTAAAEQKRQQQRPVLSNKAALAARRAYYMGLSNKDLWTAANAALPRPLRASLRARASKGNVVDALMAKEAADERRSQPHQRPVFFSNSEARAYYNALPHEDLWALVKDLPQPLSGSLRARGNKGAAIDVLIHA